MGEPDLNQRLMEPQFAVCINNAGYPASLVLRKLYQVLTDDKAAEHHQLRVIDESGEDYLYPENFFVRIEVPQAVEKELTSAEAVERLKELRRKQPPISRAGLLEMVAEGRRH